MHMPVIGTSLPPLRSPAAIQLCRWGRTCASFRSTPSSTISEPQDFNEKLKVISETFCCKAKPMALRLGLDPVRSRRHAQLARERAAGGGGCWSAGLDQYVVLLWPIVASG